MGKMLMLVIAGLGIVFAMAGFQRNQSTLRMTANSSENWENDESKSLAKSGVDMAIMQLSQNPQWNGVITTRSGSDGTLHVSAEPTTSSFPGGTGEGLTEAHLITSVAQVNGAWHQVLAVVQFKLENAELPPAFAYGIMSESTLNLSGNVNILDDGNPTWNADIHSNHDINLNGTNNVEGYGSFSGSISSDPPEGLNTTFQPNVPESGPVQYQAPPVALPDVDIPALEKMATVTGSTGETVSGDITLGTKENPHIYFVRGDLQLNGNMTGYGIFIVDGDLEITGNLMVSTGDPDGSTVGIVSTGEIRIAGNTEVHASIFSQGNVTCEGTSEIHGNIITGGALTFGGTTDIITGPLEFQLREG